MVDIHHESLPNLNDVTSWIFECNRYLFFGKICLNNPSFEMKFTDDPIIYVEKISSMRKMIDGSEGVQNNLLLLEPREKSRKIPSKFEVHIDIAESKISELNETILLIKQRKWEKLSKEKIENCQKSLVEFFDHLKKEIASRPAKISR